MNVKRHLKMESFLIWVGSEHYSSIAEYSDEAIVQGVSKRVPGLSIAKAMSAPDSVVFVAHDEGERHDCPSCIGEVECPECRKRVSEIERWAARRDEMTARIGALEPGRQQQRVVDTAESHISQLEKEREGCADCNGRGRIEAGTGGNVHLRDGQVWDHRRYVYWRNRNQLERFDFRKDVRKVYLCKDCGGRGVLPNGKVFGLFVPDRIEYIAHPGEDKSAIKELEAAGVSIVSLAAAKKEAPRGCGRRKAGGFYVVTTPKMGGSKAAKETAKKLAELGVSDVELSGSFIKFGDEIPIKDKRFRGVKRWKLPVAEAVDAAEQIVEALAG